jgi:5-deoxy-glucuronate isomerase
MSAMLAEMLFRIPRGRGLQLLQQRGDRGSTELTSWRLSLGPGDRHSYRAPDEETVAVLQQGSGTFEAADSRWEVSRRSVFAERATAVYLPPGVPLVATATEPLEAILISAPAAGGGQPAIVRPEEVQPLARGRGVYTREVHNLFVDDAHVKRLMVGETFNPPGHWSSFPPHKHDGRHGEPTLEEVYHYRIDPPQGFGYQMLYTLDGEAVAHVVRDGDAVLLPYGFHPVSSPPGYQLYYLWGMAGAQRKLALFEYPDHTWIHQADPSAVGA